jgi:chromosome segregation ATPase
MSKVRSETELKGLQTRLTTVDQEIRNLESQQSEIKPRVAEKRSAKKHLESRLAAASEEFKQLDERRKEIEREITERRQSKKRIQQRIQQIERDGDDAGVRITEHAIVRFLERVKGIDIEQVKREMLGEKQEEVVSQLKTCKVDQGDCTLVVNNSTVVTVHDKKKPKKSKHTAAPKHKKGRPRRKDDYDAIREYENGESD